MARNLEYLNGVVARHGDSGYKQGIVSLEKADDLTEMGVLGVGINARQVVGAWEKMRLPIKISASPYGRTLHSAKLWKQVAKDYGLSATIEVVPLLGEVGGLDFKLIDALTRGGSYSHEGENVVFNVRETNPLAMDYMTFYRNHFPISKDVILPEFVRNRLALMEKPEDVAKRFRGFMALVGSETGKRVIVTHQALTDVFTNSIGLESGLMPGCYAGF